MHFIVIQSHRWFGHHFCSPVLLHSEKLSTVCPRWPNSASWNACSGNEYFFFTFVLNLAVTLCFCQSTRYEIISPCRGNQFISLSIFYEFALQRLSLHFFRSRFLSMYVLQIPSLIKSIFPYFLSIVLFD